MNILEKLYGLLIILILFSYSCDKGDNNEPIDEINKDYRDNFIGTYNCVVKHQYWNTVDTFLSYSYSTTDLEVVKSQIVDYFIILGIGSWKDEFKFDFEDSTLLSGPYQGGGGIGCFYKDDSLYLYIDPYGLGPDVNWYYGKKK